MAILDTIKNQILVQSEDGSANKQEKIPLISKLCPHCHGCVLEFTEDEGHVRCYADRRCRAPRDLLVSR